MLEIKGLIINVLPEDGEVTLESGAIVARAGISTGLKIACLVFLPLTCLGFRTWSLVKVNTDCNKLLITFDRAFYSHKFETLFVYIDSIKNSIYHLKCLGQKIIQDDIEENS